MKTTHDMGSNEIVRTDAIQNSNCMLTIISFTKNHTF